MKRILLSFATLVTIGMVGCKKDLLDINNDPNRATYSTPQLTMPIALENAARIANTSYFSLAFWTGYWATSNGFSKPVETYTYNITSSYMQGVWDNLYNNLADFNYIEKQAIAQNLPVYEGVAKVMKAYDFHQAVDLWGNVPYSEALQGAANLSPKYDAGETIYDDLIKKIDSAIAIFKKPATATTINVPLDKAKILLFGSKLNVSDPDGSSVAFLKMWVKFANTLKLKLLVQQSQLNKDAYIKSELQGLTSDDFLSLGEDALVNPGYTTATAKLNPYYGAFYKSYNSAGDNFNSTRASDYAVTQYKNLNDPRIAYFYTLDPGANGVYLGSVFGDPTGTAYAARVGSPSLQATGPSIIMTAAESLFLQAEAAQRGYITGDAKQLYENAVTASFNFTGTSGAAVYLAQNNPDVNWNLATNKIQLIITQKWFALNGIDILAVYNDYRRTGFPNVPLSTDANSKGKVPVRLFYPQRESLLNTANVEAQGNVDVFSTTVFWDK
jgi:hypothetical protein